MCRADTWVVLSVVVLLMNVVVTGERLGLRICWPFVKVLNRGAREVGGVVAALESGI